MLQLICVLGLKTILYIQTCLHSMCMLVFYNIKLNPTYLRMVLLRLTNHILSAENYFSLDHIPYNHSKGGQVWDLHLPIIEIHFYLTVLRAGTTGKRVPFKIRASMGRPHLSLSYLYKRIPVSVPYIISFLSKKHIRSSRLTHILLCPKSEQCYKNLHI